MPGLVHVLGEVLGHALGERGDQRAVAALGDLAHLVDQVVDLRLGRAHLTGGSIRPVGRITCSTKAPPVSLELPAAGRRRDERRLRAHGVPLLEAQRAIVHARGQAEAVFGQRRLAPVVAAEHAADLRHGHVALVDEHERVVGQVLEQRRRRLAGLAAGEIARIVLDAGAGARRLHHLHVEDGALLQALGLQQLAGGVQLVEALLELALDAT